MKRLLMVALGISSMMALTIGSTARAQGRRLVFEETIIEGKVQKPEITIFITRQNLGTEYVLELKESFIPKIVKSVEKKPF
jgi:D-aminopeptidase